MAVVADRYHRSRTIESKKTGAKRVKSGCVIGSEVLADNACYDSPSKNPLNHLYCEITLEVVRKRCFLFCLSGHIGP